MSMIRTFVEVQLAPGGAWVDVTPDCVDDITGRYGIEGGGPADRVAGTGALACHLNNADSNVAGVRGYYSPGHINVWAGFDYGIKLRVGWTDGDTTVYRGVGVVNRIVPTPDTHGEQTVYVEATDWMDRAAQLLVVGIDTQTGKRADEILTLLLAAAPADAQPEAVDLDVCDSTFTYALDNVSNQTPLLAAAADLTQSEGGYLALLGDGTLRLWKRTARASVATAVASLENTVQGLAARRARGDTPTKILITIHPRRVDAAATTVLYSLDTQPAISAGQTIKILSPYGDPLNGNKRCGGTDMVTPAATTDYTANTAANGSGTDKTGALTVVANFGAAGVLWTITNTDAGTVYLTKLQCRGRGIYDYQAVQLEAGADADQPNVCRVDMPYQDDLAVGSSFADYLLTLYETSVSLAESVTLAATDAASVAAMLAIDVGNRIAVTEAQTGISAAFFVQSVAYQSPAVGPVTATYGLAPALADVYWVLGTAGASELGDTTRLGFS